MKFCDIISIHHEFEGRIDKFVPRITDWHHEACRVMTIVDTWGRIFLSHPHTHDGYFFLLTTKYLFLYYKDMKKLHATWWCHFNITMMSQIDVRHRSTCGQHADDMQLFIFYLSLGLVRVCEIELSHMGKNKGNLDPVCENIVFCSWNS